MNSSIRERRVCVLAAAAAIAVKTLYNAETKDIHLLVRGSDVVCDPGHHTLHVTKTKRSYDVRDERDGEHLHVQVSAGDDLVHRAHARSITPDHAQEVALRRRLVAGTGLANIDALLDQVSLSLVNRHLAEDSAQVLVVRVAQRGETSAHLLVVATDLVVKAGVSVYERIVARHAQEADVVRDHHQVSDLEGAVQAASRVGENDHLHAQRLHQHDGDRRLLRRVSLIEVVALAQANAGNAANGAVIHGEGVVAIAHYSLPRRRRRTVGAIAKQDFLANLTTGHFGSTVPPQIHAVLECIAKSAQPRAAHDAHTGLVSD